MFCSLYVADRFVRKVSRATCRLACQSKTNDTQLECFQLYSRFRRSICSLFAACLVRSMMAIRSDCVTRARCSCNIKYFRTIRLPVDDESDATLFRSTHEIERTTSFRQVPRPVVSSSRGNVLLRTTELPSLTTHSNVQTNSSRRHSRPARALSVRTHQLSFLLRSSINTPSTTRFD
jgi:hypothetical protein